MKFIRFAGRIETINPSNTIPLWARFMIWLCFDDVHEYEIQNANEGEGES